MYIYKWRAEWSCTNCIRTIHMIIDIELSMYYAYIYIYIYIYPGGEQDGGAQAVSRVEEAAEEHPEQAQAVQTGSLSPYI
jgi:hypothetical protein